VPAALDGAGVGRGAVVTGRFCGGGATVLATVVLDAVAGALSAGRGGVAFARAGCTRGVVMAGEEAGAMPVVVAGAGPTDEPAPGAKAADEAGTVATAATESTGAITGSGVRQLLIGKPFVPGVYTEPLAATSRAPPSLAAKAQRP